MDNSTLQRLTAHGDVADLIWEAPADLAAEHGQLLMAAVQAHQTGNHETGERLWQQAHTLWSRAWSANYEALKLMQAAGLARFTPVKPQRWVIASFEHHCGPHGLPNPHVHNVVATSLSGAVGVFQVVSLAQMAMLPRLRPAAFYDLDIRSG